ncbi:Cell division protein C [uncultured archaeon]|nr:Cell division protein C [uncultured archaeon]
MNATVIDDWHEANQKYLTSVLAIVREALEHHAAPGNSSTADVGSSAHTQSSAEQAMKQAADNLPAPPALDILCEVFALSTFERNILLLCAGMELDSSFASLCASAQGDTMRAYPTFSLALAALPDPHWSALTPTAPLRRWRLIEIGTGNALTLSPLRIDERVLHYLVGIQHLDERLAGLVQPLYTSGELVPSHRRFAERLAMIWSNAAGTSALPVVQLCGNEVTGKRTIAGAACALVGLKLSKISAATIPIVPGELEAFIRLWEREAILSASALLVDFDIADTTDAAHDRAINQLIECTNGALIIASGERRSVHQRQMVTFDVRKPTPGEQCTVWQSMLGRVTDLNGQVEAIASQFNLSTHTIHDVCAEAQGLISDDDKTSSNKPGDVLWDACRVQTRPRMSDLAQHIESVATWDDLVLPEQQRQVLREVTIQVRQRFKVYETWGFASKGQRGLGISALFVGASGTGKTMAAEVLANELRLDLYRIDLSQVVSKYIGETEKNMGRIFDAAEDGGAILLFDEADALFGKRSEVKDSHDRYANIEISYLLQRMEAYCGLAILTTNMKSALDTAFLRRIRFIVQFPFPDTAQRAEIWGRIFPTITPTNGLNVEKLARLNVAGGNIRNIALNAAFLAAEANEPVSMKHLLHAARTEYAKLEKPLTEAEIGGWV